MNLVSEKIGNILSSIKVNYKFGAIPEGTILAVSDLNCEVTSKDSFPAVIVERPKPKNSKDPRFEGEFDLRFMLLIISNSQMNTQDRDNANFKDLYDLYESIIESFKISQVIITPDQLEVEYEEKYKMQVDKSYFDGIDFKLKGLKIINEVKTLVVS